MGSGVIIGIDESYTRTGVTALCNKEILRMQSIDFEGCSCNAEKRMILRNALTELLSELLERYKPNEIKCIIERIRTFSGGHMSSQYLITTGGLISTIIDVFYKHRIKVYSVDTKSWKNNVVGNSKPMQNKYGINPNKYPTILYMRDKGLLNKIAEPYIGRGKKGVIICKYEGKKVPCKMNDDLADSYCIAMYGFLPKSKQKLKEEKI